MFIERDVEFDQLYINLCGRITDGAVAETVEVRPGVHLDLDAGGKLVGIEIVSAEKVIGIPAADLDPAGELVGVKEAAALAGKNRANFLRDLASQPDFPRPVARIASGQIWLSRDIEQYLKTHQVAVRK